MVSSQEVSRQYEVGLSFAGEQRDYVEEVARHLQTLGISVFYDRFEAASLWGKHLTQELQGVYEEHAQLAVMFISKEYVEKAWPQHERQSILSRMVRDSREYALPVRFDATPVPGFPSDVSYLLATEYSPAEIASLIAEKLGYSPFSSKASNVPSPRMTSLTGEVVFDYSNHNGLYIIGRGQWEFETKWSKSSDRDIIVYNDPPSLNGVAVGRPEWTTLRQVVDAKSLNYTSRTRRPKTGQIVVLRNVHGFYATLHVLSVKDDTRNDDVNELRFEYAIQADGSDDFSSFGAPDD